MGCACGTGFITRSLAEKMRLVYGIDISMGMLEKAAEYAGKKGDKKHLFCPQWGGATSFPGWLV